ncbi:MAG: response regulator transcription factor [Oscillospiraceae bacterium]
MGKAKILIIEDETDVLALNKEYLESQGYDVFGVQALAQARFHVEEQLPDLILLDVMMPDGMGWDFCAEIREKTNAPVIFLTCRDETDSVVKGLLKGGDDYITKPYDLNVLGARIAAQLRRAGIMSAGKIELFPLVIDLLAGEVTLDGERISLTQKEIQLLACFVLFAGRRLSCEEIYRRAWGGSMPGASNTIAVHVTKLRKKLKLDDGSCFELRSTGKEEYLFSKVRY